MHGVATIRCASKGKAGMAGCGSVRHGGVRMGIVWQGRRGVSTRVEHRPGDEWQAWRKLNRRVETRQGAKRTGRRGSYRHGGIWPDDMGKAGKARPDPSGCGGARHGRRGRYIGVAVEAGSETDRPGDARQAWCEQVRQDPVSEGDARLGVAGDVRSARCGSACCGRRVWFRRVETVIGNAGGA